MRKNAMFSREGCKSFEIVMIKSTQEQGFFSFTKKLDPGSSTFGFMATNLISRYSFSYPICK